MPCHLVVHRLVSSSVQAREGFVAAAEEAARLKKKFKTQQAVTDALGQVRRGGRLYFLTARDI